MGAHEALPGRMGGWRMEERDGGGRGSEQVEVGVKPGGPVRSAPSGSELSYEAHSLQKARNGYLGRVIWVWSAEQTLGRQRLAGWRAGAAAWEGVGVVWRRERFGVGRWTGTGPGTCAFVGGQPPCWERAAPCGRKLSPQVKSSYTAANQKKAACGFLGRTSSRRQQQWQPASRLRQTVGGMTGWSGHGGETHTLQ